MVANLTQPHNCKFAVDYIMAIREEDKKTQLLMHSSGVLPTDNKTIAACLEAASMLGDHNLKQPFKHISLNFHKADKEKLTDDFMHKVATDYMAQMGYSDTEFVIYRHFDKEHPHCHIVASRVNRKGKVISNANERRRNIEVFKALNQKYELHQSKCKEAVNKECLKGTVKLRQEMMDKVIIARDKSEDWKQFEDQLKNQGIKLKFHYNNVTRELMGVSFADGKYSCSGKHLDNSLVYARLAEKFGDVHELAHENVKNYYDQKVESLLWINDTRYHSAIMKAFPDFDVTYPVEKAIAKLPNAFSLMDYQSNSEHHYVDYDADEYIPSKDAQTGFIPLGLMIAVALAPYTTPIEQCSCGGGGGSSNSNGYKDDDDKDKWKFRFKYNRSMLGQRRKGRSL